MPRELAKRFAERLLLVSGAASLSRTLRGGRSIILAYHNIVPDGAARSGDGSLHLSRADFSEQLDFLMRTHEVVPLSEMAGPEPTRRARVAITFDDAYEGALTLGVEELRRRALPATIFVAPAFVGGGDFWWDVLAPDGSLPPQIRAVGLAEFGGDDKAIRRWAAERGYAMRTPPRYHRCATLAQLTDAATAAGITFGSHTWSHPNLIALSEAQLESELTRPLDWLRTHLGEVVAWLSYPYGLRSAAVEWAAERAGYAAALCIDGGWLPRAVPKQPTYALPRLNIPAGVSREGFALRLAGLIAD